MQPKLDAADLEKVLEAGSAILGSSEVGDSSLSAIATLVPCDVISYNEISWATGVATASVWPPPWARTAEEVMATFESVVDDNPLVAHFRRHPSARVLRFEDVASEADVHNTDFFQRFFQPLEFRHQMAINLPCAEDRTVGVALNGRSAPFSDRHVALLLALLPQLKAAIRLRDAESARSNLYGALASSGWLVVRLDSNGLVSTVDGYEGSDLQPGGAVPGWLLRHVARAAADLDRRPTPTDSLAAQVEVHPDGKGVVILARLEQVGLRDWMRTRGFTERQVDVAQELMVGGTNDMIARRLKISTGTVRKHLEAIFRGLEVDDRASAVAALRRCVT